MSKSRKEPFNLDGAMGRLGIPEIENVDALNASRKVYDERSKANALAEDKLAPRHEMLKYDKDVYGSLLEPYQWGLDGTQMNDAVSDNQNGAMNLVKMLERIPTIAYQKFLSQTASLAHAIDNKVIGRTDENAMSDEALSDYMQERQEAEQAIKEFFPVYEHSKYKDKSILEQMGTTQFWADTGADGVAFVLAQAIGTKGLAGAAGTLGKAASALFPAISASQKAVKYANFATSTAISIANAGSTASMQGEQAYREVYETLQQRIDPKTGVLYTDEQARAKASEAAARTFNNTFATHMIPAIWETRAILSASKSLEGAVGIEARKKLVAGIRSGKINVSDLYTNPAKYLNKSVGKSVLKEVGLGAILEGPYEENIENAIVAESVDNVLNNVNRGRGERLLEYGKQMIGNLSNKEALTEMVIGSVIGSGMGAFKGYNDASRFNKGVAGYVGSMQAADNLYFANANVPFARRSADGVDEKGNPYKQGDIIYDENGEPQVDQDVLRRLARQNVAHENLADSTTNAFINNDPETIWMNENIALSSSVFSELERAKAYGDTVEGAMELLSVRLEKRIDEIEKEQNATTETTPEEGKAPTQAEAKVSAHMAQRKNIIRTKVQEMGRELEKAETSLAKKIGINDSPERTQFLEVAKKTLFYEASKRMALNQTVADLNESLTDPLADREAIAKKIEALGKLKESSFETSKALLHDTNKAFAEWDSYGTFIKENMAVQDELSKKQNLTAEEKVKYDTAQFNAGKAYYERGDFAATANPAITINPVTRGKLNAGRTEQMYDNIGKQVTTEKDFKDAMAAGDTDKGLYAISRMHEKSNEVEDTLTDAVDTADAELKDVTERVDKAFDEAPDTVVDYDPTTYTDEINALIEEEDLAKDKVAKLKRLEDAYSKLKDTKLMDMSPEEVAEQVEMEYIDSLQSPSEHIIKVALQPNGEVSEDFTDVNSTMRAIDKLERHKNWHESTFQKSVPAEYLQQYEDTLELLDQMRKILESANLNKNNLVGKQKAIANERAEAILSIIEDPTVTPIFESIFGSGFSARIQEIRDLTENKLEAVNALMAYIAEKGKTSELTDALNSIRDKAKQDFTAYHQSKGIKPTTHGAQFKNNPSAALVSIWIQLANKTTGVGVDATKGSPYEKFENTKNYADLFASVDDEAATKVAKEDLETLAQLAYRAESAIKAKLLLANSADQASELLGIEGSQPLVPTEQQEIAVREGATWINKKKGEGQFENWGYLRGVAGTGKTNIVLRWMLSLAGIQPENMIGVAKKETATNVLGKSIGAKAVQFHELDLDNISDEISLIVIDEYATIETAQLRAFEEKVRLLNQNRARKISVMILGDPTQITSNGASNFDLTVYHGREKSFNIQQFNPLTVVYRSEVSGVNEFSSLFQGNRETVQDISVRASSEIDSPLALGSHVVESGASFADTIARNIEEEKKSGVEPRSRVIIVGSDKQMAKYQGIEGANVILVEDSQSQSYDEVYVDLNPSDFGNPFTFNGAAYTAISRAKKYVQYVGEGTNNIDPSLTAEQNTNLTALDNSHAEFRARKDAEVGFLEDLRKGTPLNTTQQSTPTPPVASAPTGTANPATSTVQATTTVDDEIEEEADEEFTESEEEIETVEDTAEEANEKQTVPDDVNPNTDVDPETSDVVTSVPSDPAQIDGPDDSFVSEPNIDTEFYNAVKANKISPSAEVVYIKNEDGDVESYVRTNDGDWVKLGFYPQTSVMPAELQGPYLKAQNAKRGFVNAMSKNKLKAEELASQDAVLMIGELSSATLMAFNYSATPNEGKGSENIVDWMKNKFKGFFGNSPLQKARENKISFRIFSKSELAKPGYIKSGYEGKLRAGVPYMIIGGEVTSTGIEHAFFVPMQPLALSQDSSQVKDLKRFRDSVAKLSAITGLQLGSQPFNDMILSLKGGLEVQRVKNADGTTSMQVVVKPNFSYADFEASIQRRNTPKGNNSTVTFIKNPLRKLDPSKHQEAINAGLEVASQVYGYTTKPTLYTQKEIDDINSTIEAGDEFIGVDSKRPLEDGTQRFYGYHKLKAQGRQPSSVYETEDDVDSSKGTAQIALNQIARANEFVGGTRIRVSQFGGKTKRHKSGTGKSIITAKGGGSKINAIHNLIRTHFQDLGWTDEDLTSKNIINEIRATMKNNGSSASIADWEASVRSWIQNVQDPTLQQELTVKLDSALKTTETPPITLETLDKIVGDENFENGRHKMGTENEYVNAHGENRKGQTYLRTPINRDKFNSIGRNPMEAANKNVLDQTVTTRLGDTKATSAEVLLRVAAQNTSGIAPTSNNPVYASRTDELNAELKEIQDSINSGTMSAREKLKAKVRIAEIEAELNKKAFDASLRGTTEHNKISISKAKAIFKQMLPSASESDLEFLTKALLDKYANADESLYGLYINNRILVETENGTVSEQVLRHEIFHKIFNEYLTEAERNALMKSRRGESKTAHEIEEELADKFMLYKQYNTAPTPTWKRILNKIASWFGLIDKNELALTTVFENIIRGKYTEKVSEGKVRRAYSDRFDYGAAANYKEARSMVRGIISKDIVDANGFHIVPMTLKEAYNHVKSIMHAEIANIPNSLAKDEAELQSILDEIPVEERDAEIQKEIDLLKKSNEAKAERLAFLQKMFPVNSKNGKITDSVFKRLWEDIFPTYDFINAEVTQAELEKILEFDTMSDETKEKLDLSGLLDFVLQADVRNEESKMSAQVKNFFSFMVNDEGKSISPRQAYFSTLLIANELSSGNVDIVDQIKHNASSFGIDLKSGSNMATVINKVIDLVNDAFKEQDVTVIEKKSYFMDLNKFAFVDENKYISATTQKTYNRLKGESTLNFLDKIKTDEKANNPEMDPTLVEHTIHAAFRQTIAQETLRSLFSLFSSQSYYNYMIAESEWKRNKTTNEFGLNWRYMEAQSYGAEKATASDVINAFIDNFGQITGKQWKEFMAESDPKKRLTFFIKDLLKISTGHITTSRAKEANAAIEGLKVSYENTVVTQELITNELTGEKVPVSMENLLNDDKKLINIITSALVSDTVDSIPSTFRSSAGEIKYVFAMGSQAREIVTRLVNYAKGNGFEKAFHGASKNEKLNNSLPPHLQGDWGVFNPFVSRKNTIYSIRDHDGMRQKNRPEASVDYSSETDAEFMERNLIYGFSEFMAGVNNSIQNSRYVQFFYTISNKPRIVGAEVDFLNNERIRDGINTIVEQTLRQPDIVGISNYDPSKMVNASFIKAAIEETIKGKFDRATWEKYRNTGFTESQLKEIQDRVISRFVREAKNLMKRYEGEAKAEKLKSLRSNGIINNNGGVDFTIDGEHMYDDQTGEVMKSAVDSDLFSRPDYNVALNFVANNYINSYFLNQTVVGNFNFFKSGLDMVKRMSGVFAPGAKGISSSTSSVFMRPQYRVAVMNDPILPPSVISEIFEGTDLKKLGESKDVEFADGQAFMLPSRLDEIKKGYGEAYKAGRVLKPAYYGNVNYKDANGVETSIPFMKKYSSVELSDDLVNKFPKLKVLRDAMLNAKGGPIDEVIFDSGTKVGKPKASRPMPTGFDEDFSIEIGEDAMFNLDNENYRLQLNPSSHAFGQISFMTQLAYFMNTGHRALMSESLRAKNESSASAIYSSFARLAELGLAKFNKDVKGGKISKNAILKSLKGEESAGIASILREGGSYNLPHIVDKALIQTMNGGAKTIVKPKFAGGHFVLQAPYGVEIIGKGNTTYTDTQKKANYDNLTPEGKKVADELGEKSRNLKYKKDSQGNIVAEVILPKEFADNVKAGDFVLPDALGYRIPSTGLHSSIALQVVGYYDSVDSNIIIAPPELVLQHGSDFDVDSLYVLGREVIQGDNFLETSPLFKPGYAVGYENGKLLSTNEFNKILSSIPDSDKNKAKIEEMYHKNVIAENFISTVTDPENLATIAEPISPESIEVALKELGISEANENVDLSSFLDNLEVYNSNFQGAKLVGTFANGAKALAYMLYAGKDKSLPSIPRYQTDEGAGNKGLNIFGKIYNQFSEQSGRYSVWQILDALINSSVDNVKEQKLHLMNATDSTGNLYVAGLAMGIPLPDLIEFMLQPLMKEFTAQKGKSEKVAPMLVAAFNRTHRGLTPAVSIEDIYKMAKDNDWNFDPEVAKASRGKRLINITDGNEVLQQVLQYRSGLIELEKLAKNIKDFSGAIKILQDFPVTYADILSMDKRWASVFSTAPDGSLVKEEDGRLKMHNEFAFDLSELFQNQVNIKTAYEAYNTVKGVAFNSFVKHNPALNKLAEILTKRTDIKISYNDPEASLKNELFSYFLSSMYAEEIANTPNITYSDRSGKKRVLVGKYAWSHQFAQKIEQAKKKLKGNEFMDHLSVQTSWGVSKLQFNQTSGKDIAETFSMQEGFETLPESIDGLFEPGELQEGLVRYAVLNFGMKFGNTNYSSFLTADALSNVDEYINRTLKGFLSNVSRIGVEGFLNMSSLEDIFADQLAINEPESLPRFQSKDNPAVITGSFGGKNTYSGMAEVVTNNGIKQIWFNSSFKLKKGVNAPMYYRSDFDGVFRIFKRIGEPIVEGEEKIAYYQMMGFKNYLGGYNPIPLSTLNDVKVDTFNGVLAVPVSDMNETMLEVHDAPVNKLKKGDMVWVYPASDVTRQTGKAAKVVKPVFNTSGDKNVHRVHVKHLSEEELSDVQINFKAQPLVAELSRRFGVEVRAVTAENMPKGTSANKGTIRNGIVYLNFSLLNTSEDLHETAFHEISHPIIAEIAQRNPIWYQNLVKELETEGSQGAVVLAKVKTLYPELTHDEQIQEALVTLVGQYSAHHRAYGTSLSNYIKKLIDSIGSFLKKLLSGKTDVSLDSLSNADFANLSLSDIGFLLAHKGDRFNLHLGSAIKQDWDSRRLEEVEEKLFKEGRVSFTCKL